MMVVPPGYSSDTPYPTPHALPMSCIASVVSAPRDAILLRDPDPRQISDALTRLEREMTVARADSRRVELLFYYSGHSDTEGLLLGESLLPYRELRDSIEAVDADVAVALLDSCSSGSFTRLKGGRRAQPFLFDDAAEITGYAFLTSSSDTEASQESDEIAASFFTHYLVSGLLGAADTTGDGKVTLNEAYQHAFAETSPAPRRRLPGAAPLLRDPADRRGRPRPH
jgi:hypothetical protein